MPGVSGLDAVRALRRGECRIPVLLLTGFPDIDMRREARAAGVDSVVGKPIGPQELLDEIRRLSLG